MKIEYEIVRSDPGSSFRLLHHKMVKGSDFIWQYHYHPEFEIVYVPRGSGTRHVGNHLSTYHQGDLVLIGSNLPHSGFGLNSPDLHEEVVLQIKPEALSMNFPEMSAIEPLLELSKYGLAFSPKTQEQVGKKILKMMEQSPFKRLLTLLDIFETLAQTKDYDILNDVVVPSALLSKHKVRLQKIFNYVSNAYQNEIHIQEVAGLVGLSVPSFCNFFKKATNITFSEFVNRYRIHKASALLQQDKSISEVCFECGFNNVTYFNKIFKQVMNETPSQLKKNLHINAHLV